MNCSNAVNTVWSVKRPCVALAMPKSISLGTGAHGVTRPTFRLTDRSLRDSGIKNPGDVRMIHQGQRLTLGFEAGNDLLGVHAQLDHLQRHPPPHRLLLLGHIDHAATPFADLL